ncbi:hypothetical protein [Streptomyces europaeiscabiei]|uniref:hypothetical protein n=1 Tax=Streptomyces europaeiscabiei TaxID=146819 RepID=UPI0029BEA7D5|nr:hypothetical protein [Streptomyces europaeiscabiei]MDX3841038.1 hypothetical protein [Streptomyces europaeiscabiei]
MADTTHTPDTSNTPTGFGYCSWHRASAAGVRLINAIEQGSGPGGGLFACLPCIEEHGLVPFADRPL